MTNNKAPRIPEGYATLSEAMSRAKMAKSTFYDAINAGHIPAHDVEFLGRKKRFVLRSDLDRLFPEIAGETPAESAGVSKSGPERTSPDESELVRLRTENAVLQARLEAAQDAQRTAERDKETLANMLQSSLDTVKFLELRATETAQLLELRKEPAAAEKKPGILSRFLRRF